MNAAAAAAAKSLQSCPTLCDPIDGSPPGSPAPGILQARTLEWVAISFSDAWKWKWSRSVVSDSFRPYGLQPTRLLCPWDFPGKSTGVGHSCILAFMHTCMLNHFSHVWLCKAMDCSPPGSSVHGVLQARTAGWVTMPSSRGSSQPRDWAHISYVSCIGRWVLYQ